MKTKVIQISEVRTGMKIKTYDPVSEEVVFRTVTDKFDTHVAKEEQVELSFTNDVIINCSVNHPIMVLMDDGQVVEKKPELLSHEDVVITDKGFTYPKNIVVGQDNDEGYIDITVEDTHTFYTCADKESEMVLTHNSQGGLRGGSATMHFPLWHTDIENLLVLKNNKGTEETRERHLDYSVGISGYFLDRLIKGKNITLLPPNLEGLYDAFYEDPKKFRELYEHYEKSDEVPAKFKKTISASKLFGSLLTEGKNTGRVYIHVVDEMNRHTPFERTTDPIHQSNLCLAGDTQVRIRNAGNGQVIALEELNDLFHRYHEIEVLSYNIDGDKREYKKVTASAMTGRNRKVMRITDEDTGKSIVCTPEHKVFTENRGYVEAKNLHEDDELNIIGGESKSVLSYEYIEGEIDVYDITVEDNHNFYANDVLVHNCQEIALPTRPFYSTEDEDGRIALCTLANSNWGEFSNPQTMKHPLRRVVRGLDNILTMQEYPMVQARRATEEFRPLGIGVNNLAYFLAKNNTSYSDPKALPLVHSWMEHMAYYMQEASIDLAKERGACERSAFTKRAKGVMLVDTYKKTIDEIVSNDLELDWDALRRGAKEYGVRNATLSATMPSESNSQVMNCMSFDTQITTSLGQMSFKDFVESQGLVYEDVIETGGDMWFDVDDNITVKNMNGEQEPVTGLYYNGDVVVDEIELEDGTVLKCTPDHKFLVHRDGKQVWVKVKDLQEGDDIVEVE